MSTKRKPAVESFTIATKRVYQAPEAGDGQRILVDRLWPRGLSKTEAKIDLWARDLAPSSELRRWFAHDPQRWEEFRRRYRAELEAQAEAVSAFVAGLRPDRVTLLYAAKDERFNNAQALKAYLESRGP